MEKVRPNPLDSSRVRPAKVFQDGVVAGLLGALVVAVAHMIADVVAGEPLRTPATLGVLLAGAASEDAGAVLRFTCFHIFGWVLVGGLGSWLISVVDAHPRLLPLIFGGFVAVFTSVLYVLGALSVPGLPPHHLWVATLLGSAAAAGYLALRHPQLARHVEREHLAETTRLHLERALDHEAAGVATYRAIAEKFPNSIFAKRIEEKEARWAMLRSRCDDLGLPPTELPESAHQWTATTLDEALREAIVFERRTIDFYDRFLAAAFELQIRELFVRLRYDVLETSLPELEREIETGN
jgi:hypothetical protein